MKTFILVVCMFCISPTSWAGVKLENSINITVCELYGLLHKITAEARDKKKTRSAAEKEIRKLAKQSPEINTDIIKHVYDVYSKKTPLWLEGYFYGICSVNLIMQESCLSSSPDVPSFLLPKKPITLM